MGLIECPDCHKHVSDLATVCIHCGRPRDAQVPARPSPVKSLFDDTSASSVGSSLSERPSGTSQVASSPSPLDCPTCGSDQTVKVSLLRLRDTSASGIGTVQSYLAAAVSPPEQRRGPSFVLALVALLFVAGILGSVDSSHILGAVLFVGGLAAFFVWEKRVTASNATEHAKQKAEWDKKYVCERCGTMFTP